MTEIKERTATKNEAAWERRQQFVPRGLFHYTHIVVDHAHGAEVWDVDGRRYIDFAGGIGTLNAGHTPQPVVEAAQRQTSKLIHMAAGVAIYEPYINLAERLAKIVPGPTPKKTLLVNSGAEALENSVKFSRAATGRDNIITFHNSFHGRTSLTLAMTGRDKPYKAGAGPLAPAVYHAQFPNAYRCPSEICHHNGGTEDCAIESGKELEELLNRVGTDKVAAIVVEPVQGEGGFIIAPPEFMQRLRQICDQYGIILVADEVQTGFGRTGQLFAMENYDVEPDLICLAKSLTAGFPLAAVVGKANIMDAPEVGSIGGTFGGNPVAAAAGYAVIDVFEQENLVEKGRHVGEVVKNRFEDMMRKYDIIGDVRALGAMAAMELVTNRQTKEPAKQATAEILHRCHDNGLIIIKAGEHDNVIRFLGPLVISDELLEEGLDILEHQLADVAGS